MISEDLTAHLSQNKLKELIDRYYEKEKCSDLINEFKINCKPSGLSNTFPPLESDKLCSCCENSKMYLRFKTRSLPKAEWRVLYCPECLHHDIKNCGCVKCIEKDKNKKLDKVIKLLKIPSERVTYKSIDDLSKFYLFVLASEENIDGSLVINSLNNFHQNLAPTSQMEIEIIEHLCRENIIIPDPYSCIDLVEEHPFKDEVYSFDRRNAQWLINICHDDISIDELVSFLKKDQSFKISNKYELMDKIRVAECVQGLISKIALFFNIEYRPSKKCYEVFEEGLKSYSISEMFYFIHIRVSGISGHWRTTNSYNNLSHALNGLIKSIENYMKKAKDENWSLTTFERPSKLPQSLLSYYFFKYIIPIGEASFKEFINNCEEEGIG